MTLSTRGPANRALNLLLDQRLTNDEWDYPLEPTQRAELELAAAVSHDLKNPLTVIKGRAQLLRLHLARREPPDLERLAKGLAQIEQPASSMVAMLDELIDLPYTHRVAASVAGRCPTDLVALARRVASEYQDLTERHRIRVRTTAAAVVGNWNAARLERVVVNLLSNAIKYSPDGGEIDLTVTWDNTVSPPWAVLRVRDRGIGIPPNDLPRIFEGLHRARNAIGRAAGTGVGLMAVRQIVEQHGGTVNVRSRERHWSTFTVRLPLVPGSEAAPNAEAQDPDIAFSCEWWTPD